MANYRSVEDLVKKINGGYVKNGDIGDLTTVNVYLDRDNFELSIKPIQEGIDSIISFKDLTPATTVGHLRQKIELEVSQ